VNVTATVSHQRDWFCISPREAAKVAGPSPGVQFLKDGRTPLIHLTHLPLLAIEFPNLYVDDTLKGTSWAWENFVEEQSHKAGFCDWFDPYSWQISGSGFLHARRGALLADVMRSGKTPTVIAAHDPASGPLVVVGPLSARASWLKWMRTRWPDIEPVLLSGRRYEREEIEAAKLVFCNYDILSSWQSIGLRQDIGTLCFDEAHLLASNHKSYRTEAALIMSPRAHRVVAATGSPLWNDPAGLWAILAVLNPGAWGKYWDFAIRYAGAHKGPHGFQLGPPTNVEELKLRLSEVMLRRTWYDILGHDPDITQTIVEVPVSENVEREIDMICLDIRQEGRLRTPVGEIARLRRVVAQQKIGSAVGAASKITPKAPVVVWTWHKMTAESIATQLKGFLITGEDTQNEREKVLDAWRKSKGALVATMGCAQAGVDLSHAEHAVFAELDWTPAVLGQAMMRTFHPDRPMHVTYIAINHRVEHALIETLRRKLHVAETLGLPASDTKIDILRPSFDLGRGDLDRLKKAILREEDD